MPKYLRLSGGFLNMDALHNPTLYETPFLLLDSANRKGSEPLQYFKVMLKHQALTDVRFLVIWC